MLKKTVFAIVLAVSLLGGVTFSQDELILNYDKISDIIIVDGVSYVDRESAEKILKMNARGLITKDNRYVKVRDLAKVMKKHALYNHVTKNVELFENNSDRQNALVMHGGGSLEGRVVSMLEHLDNSVNKDMRLIEVDIIWTSDGYPILSHDWISVSSISTTKFEGELSLETFMENDYIHNWTPLSFNDLNTWLKSNNDVTIITDVKSKNLDVLKIIVEEHPENMNRFIPQVYNFEEYLEAQKLGFNRIILTVYSLPSYRIKTVEGLKSIDKRNLYAVTMPIAFAYNGLLQSVNELGVKIYVHTVNHSEDYARLYEMGAYGIYTDIHEIVK